MVADKQFNQFGSLLSPPVTNSHHQCRVNIYFFLNDKTIKYIARSYLNITFSLNYIRGHPSCTHQLNSVLFCGSRSSRLSSSPLGQVRASWCLSVLLMRAHFLLSPLMANLIPELLPNISVKA